MPDRSRQTGNGGGAMPSDRTMLLIVRFVDGLITDEEFAELEGVLEADPAARAMFVELTAQSHGLGEIEAAAPSRDDSVAEPRGLPRGGLFVPIAVAAAILIGAAVVALYVFSVLAPEADPDAPRPVGSPVATMLIDADAVWDSEPIISGSAITREPIALRSGTVEFETLSGVALAMTGRSTLVIDSPDQVRLGAGLLHATVPANATGFSVDLPDGTRVVDLGTEFVVRTDATGADVFVLDGAVALHVPGQSPRLIVANQAAHLGIDGVTDRAFIDPDIARVIAEHSNATDREPGTLQQGLVYHETFDDHARTGSADGRIQNAGHFDGRLDESVVGTIEKLDGAEALTISLWARRTRANDSAALFIHRLEDDTVLHGFTTTPHGTERAQFRIFDQRLDTPDHALPLDGSWVHLVGVWKRGDYMNVYVNGEPAGGAAGAVPDAPLNATGIWRFANDDCCGGNRHLRGSIDDASVWTRALDSHEIKALYLQGMMGRNAADANTATSVTE